MRRVGLLVVAISFAWSGSVASADIYVPPEAKLRPGIGWICARWTERISGDFNGDGRLDRGLYHDRTRPHTRCDESRLPTRWRLSLFLGGVRVDRRMPCITAPTICAVSAVDMNRDGTAEIELVFDGGAPYVGVRQYWLIDGAIRRIRIKPPGVHDAGPGPLQVSQASDSGTRQGFGCRTHPDGRRVFIAYAGFPRHRTDGPWGFIRVRWRLDDDGMRVLGVREFNVSGRNGKPRVPSVGSCAAKHRDRHLAWHGSARYWRPEGPLYRVEYPAWVW